MRGAGRTMRSVMPVSTVMNGGIGVPGFTSVSKVPEPLPAAVLHRADLGDLVEPGRGPGRLEVEDDERHLGERRGRIVEPARRGGGGEHAAPR